MQYDWIATTAFGLEGLVRRELNGLGLDARADNGFVRFHASAEEAFDANLWLRTADRVMLLAAEDRAETFDELFRLTRSVPWHEILPRNASFPVSGKCARSRLMSVSDCQAIVKKAVAEELMAWYHMSWCDESGEKYPIQVSLHGDVARLSVDASGEALNRRGYRTWNGEAPIRETLAAAMVSLSPWREGQPLHDPCCGTGTLLIEAAFRASDRAPGLYRDFLLEKWRLTDQNETAKRRNLAKARFTPAKLPPISGSDLDGAALELAARHIRQARLDGLITLSQQDLRQLRLDKNAPLFLTNPPYGERLSDRKTCEKLYRSLHELQARHEGSALCAISAHPGFERAYGARAKKKRRLYNGRLECEFMVF
ncbi:MAG: class I SAM-dependent RNA methyltransferase [Clostridia bacterium]|nr:class I SAM-dependent RNA methyltransferase [Clostridia bacterium]